MSFLCTFVVEALIHFRSIAIKFQDRIIYHNPEQLFSFYDFHSNIWARESDAEVIDNVDSTWM